MEKQPAAYIRCLFCSTGYEEYVVQLVECLHYGTAIFPRKVKRLWKKNGWVEEKAALLPGYVFVYSEEKIEYSKLIRMPHVLKILTYQDDQDGLLEGTDREFANWIWQQEGCVGTLDAIHAGDRVEIVDGLLSRLNGKVIRVDKRKQIAMVELNVIGSVRNIWLGFEYLKEQK